MKKIFVVLLILTFGSMAWADCIAHWKLNDNADDSTVEDSEGTHTGTFHGTGKTDDYTSNHSVAGQVNSAIQFDGTNDYIDALDHDDFSPVGTALSAAAWVQLVGADSAVEFEIVGKYATNQMEWSLCISGDALYFNLWDNINGGMIGRTDTDDYSLYEDGGMYLFIVATYDGSDTSAGVKLYLDGTQVDDADSTGGSYTALVNTTSTIQMAFRYASPNKASGMIDNVMIFDTELTTSQIETLYNNGVGTESPDLITTNPLDISDRPLNTNFRRGRYIF